MEAGMIIAIVGPTASGKSAMAMKWAKKYGGEIICADSRTVYREMSIGTAKPSQEAVKHHCLDLIEPSESFSAGEFKRRALEAINDINSRHKIPLVVGGSGLYIDGLLYDFDFTSRSDPAEQRKLESMELNEIQTIAISLGISPEEINFRNKRHLVRAVERGGVLKNKKSLPDDDLVLGIDISKEELDKRIEERIALMLENGMEKETRNLLKKYGPEAPGLLAPGYKAMIEYINGTINSIESKNKFISNDKKLAKRQKTWFKRNKDIKWIKNYTEAEKLIADILGKFDTITK
jgi:tRNA dimethylallyltransferase